MNWFRMSLLLVGFIEACLSRPANRCRAAEPTGNVPAGDPTAALAAFVKQHCVSCHGAKEPKGEFRLDDLAWNPADRAGLAKWQNVFARIDAGEMPPTESKIRTTPAELARLKTLLHPHWISKSPDNPFPGQGNLVDHDVLFSQPATQPAATPARLWRVSPNAYRRLAENLVPGGGNQVVLPFGLTNDPGFRDYAFRYTVSGSETEQMVINAKAVLEYLITKRQRYTPSKVLSVITERSEPPSESQVTAAVEHLFDKALFRAPTPAESQRYVAFTTSAIGKFGNRAGLVRGLTPVLLHPEAVFRSESGSGQPDAHGRVLLGPIELAIAISYALTDDCPDAELLSAARNGKLATAADVRRETERLLRGTLSDQARVMRFFREYFGYSPAADLFKDEPVLKALNILSFT